jgi:hypothetical protein
MLGPATELMATVDARPIEETTYDLPAERF